MKYVAAFTLFSILNVATPYMTGPLMMLNETRMEEWGWLPPNVTNSTKDTYYGFDANELRFTV